MSRPVLTALAGLLLVYLAAPLAAGLLALGQVDWSQADWAGLRHASLVSVACASVATMLVAVCGVPLGYGLARSTGRAAQLAGLMVQLPLALPPLASGILLLFLFGPYAPLGWLGVTDSFAGIVLAQGFVAAPFGIIAARSAFAAQDPVLEDVAATLGHGPAARFWRVALPLAWPGIRAGLVMSWLRGFGEFGATVMLAYHPVSLPVHTYILFGSDGLPAMLPVLLPALAAACVLPLLARGLPARLWPAGRRAMPTPPATQAAGPAGIPPRIAFHLRRELDGFSLDLAWAPQQARLAILGPSGAGKSMALRLLAGLEPGGTLTLDGSPVLPGPLNRPVGWVPQSPGLLPDRTLWRQLLLPDGADPARAAAWLSSLHLAGLEHRRPHQLSLGQQQRVALARALMRPCRLLLLDEPFSALDTSLRADLRRQIAQLQQELGLTTLLVTHDPEDVFALADEVMAIADGQVLQTGKVAEVYARPADARVAALLGAAMAGSGYANAPDSIALAGGTVLQVAGAALKPGLVGWAVSPAHVRIGDGPYPAMLHGIQGDRARLTMAGTGLEALIAPGEIHRPGPCTLAIAPGAIQVWPA